MHAQIKFENEKIETAIPSEANIVAGCGNP
jgi:hypothetical protein